VRKFRLFGYNAPTSYLSGEPTDPAHPTIDLRWRQVNYTFNIPATTTLNLDRIYDELKTGTWILIAGSDLMEPTQVTVINQTAAQISTQPQPPTQPPVPPGPLSDTVTQISFRDSVTVANLRQVTIYELVGPKVTFWNYRYPETITGDTIYVRSSQPGSPLLGLGDLKNPTALAVKIRDAKDPLSQHIKAQLSPNLQRELSTPSAIAPLTEELQMRLVCELNKNLLASGTLLYDANRFAQVALDKEMRQIVTENFQGNALVRLNRLLLEAAYPDEVASSRQLEELQAGRTLLLTDGQVAPQVVTVTRVRPVDNVSDGSHAVVTFTPALTENLDSRTAKFYGNVVKATHGETVAAEPLGNGDAASEFQSFALKKSPVTFVPDATAPKGAGNTLEIRVGGVRWDAVETLFGRTANERVYTTTINNDNEMSVRFGDGKTGARLPSGRNNVVATYRQGLGRVGNVRANTLTTLLDRPVGLKAAKNPRAAQGGAEPENQEAIRINAPNTVRTFNRVVSLRDFEDAAREYVGIAKAQATWVWDGEQQVVFLTVAGDDGAEVDGKLAADLKAYLDARRDPNRGLRLESFRKVPITVRVTIEVDVAYVAEAVQQDAIASLKSHFAFEKRDLGQSVHLSDVYQALQEVEGVVAVDIGRLQFKRGIDRSDHGASTDDVQKHLGFFAARLVNPRTADMAPAELAVIEEPMADIVIEIGRIER
jgi:uncharacterized phage protein gp47/JayE